MFYIKEILTDFVLYLVLISPIFSQETYAVKNKKQISQ